MRNHQSETTVLWAWEYRDDAHPRPADVARLEALLNTVDHHRYGAHAAKPDEQRDLLSDPERVTRWLAAHGLLEDGHPVAQAHAAAVRTFRDGLRAYLEHRDTDEPPPAGWPPATLHLQVEADTASSRLKLASASDGVAGALERLVADAVVADAKGILQRLKICAARDCRFAYYDHSRSRTSRWCSMQTCGNRLKTRHYRRRRR